jgi:hypothetical protein
MGAARRVQALGGEEVVRGGRDGGGVEVEEDVPEEDGEELGEEGDREHGVAPGRVGDAGLFGRWWLEWELGKAGEAQAPMKG